MDVSVIFKSVVRKNVYLMWKYLSKGTFEKTFINGCRLICVDDEEGLSIQF